MWEGLLPIYISFLFNRCPFFIDDRELFINVQIFGSHCVSNFETIKLYPYINDFEKVCVKTLNVPSIHYLQDHIMCHNFMHTILLTCFFKQ
jgi:hypothetical protein